MFQRLLGYLRAPLRFFFNPLRLPLGRFMRLTNSSVVSSRFSRLGLGLDRTMIAYSLGVMDRNDCAYCWRTSSRHFLVIFDLTVLNYDTANTQDEVARVSAVGLGELLSDTKNTGSL